MRWLRRRSGDPSQPTRGRPGSQPTAPRASTVTRDDPDWRSYDLIADAYAQVHAPRTAMVAADLVALAAIRAGDRVLDVATGTGVTARAAAAVTGTRGLSVGIDSSLPMLRAAHREGQGLYAAAEVIDLPFADQTFDVVLSSFGITHFQKYDTAVFDMLRVLRAGGRLGVTAWGPGEDEFTRSWDEVAESFAGPEILRDASDQALPWAERFADPGRLKDALHGSGLRDIQVERREYRFEMTAEDYLEGREVSATGRFLHQMLGEELWDRFRQRTREVFAQRFHTRFNDFREAILAVGTKPEGS